MSSAAVFLYCAAPAERRSSRRRKAKRLLYPSLPPARLVEGREGDEELHEGVVLAAKEVGEADRFFAGGRHEPRVARVPKAS
jgi:hypothetical protein